jgi:hypothetical protein
MTMKDVEQVWSEYNDSGCSSYKPLQFVFQEKITIAEGLQ